MKLFVGTPTYGGMCTSGYTTSVLNLSLSGIPVQFDLLSNEALLSRARNILVDNFMKTDCTHLLFIDSDIKFRVEDVNKLIRANKEVIGATYPMKKLPIQYVVNQLKGISSATEISKVESIGTGFLLIQRDVFVKYKQHYPKYSYKSDQQGSIGMDMFAYFNTDIINGRFLSEDYYFEHMWCQMGGFIWIYPTIRLAHIGQHEYQ